ncbi:MAG: hypothetical protein WD016_12455 [Balneolaceae bacterium]
MGKVYKAILKNGRLSWIDKKPIQDEPIELEIKVLEHQKSGNIDNQKAIAILTKLAKTGSLNSINDPARWQRSMRKDRSLS